MEVDTQLLTPPMLQSQWCTQKTSVVCVSHSCSWLFSSSSAMRVSHADAMLTPAQTCIFWPSVTSNALIWLLCHLYLLIFSRFNWCLKPKHTYTVLFLPACLLQRHALSSTSADTYMSLSVSQKHQGPFGLSLKTTAGPWLMSVNLNQLSLDEAYEWIINFHLERRRRVQRERQQLWVF